MYRKVVFWMLSWQWICFQVKSQDSFDAWVSKLRHHRLYRQNEIVRSPRDASFHIFPSASTTESSPAANVSDGKVRSVLQLKSRVCLACSWAVSVGSACNANREGFPLGNWWQTKSCECVQLKDELSLTAVFITVLLERSCKEFTIPRKICICLCYQGWVCLW